MGDSSKEKLLTTMTTKGLILTLFCYFILAHTKPQYEEPISFWNTAKPGELLKSLDAVTSSNLHFIEPVQLEGDANGDSKTTQLQRRIGESSAESLEEKSPYDYDKAYEEFVKKYFDDAVTDALSASDSSENVDHEQHDAETYSGEEVDSSEVDEPVSEASKKSAKTEKCKKLERGQQNCLICKNPRNGETSESCSYNKETKPQSYAFEKQQKFRKYRATPKSSDNEDSTEHVSTAKTSSSLRKPIIRLPPNKTNQTSSCTMNKLKNKVCYYCENGKGEKVTNCYAEEIPVKSNLDEESKKEPKKKLQKSHQRIYKRTISYTYENTPHAEESNNTVILEKPLIQKHFLLKEFNENER